MKHLEYASPFLVAVSPALFLWGRNAALVNPGEALVTIAFLAVLAAAVFGASWFVFRSVPKAGIIASITLALMLFYQNIFFNAFFMSIVTLRHRVAIALAGVFVVAVGYIVWKRKHDFLSVAQFVGVAAIVFSAISAFQIVGTAFAERVSLTTPPAVSDAEPLDAGRTNEEEELHDIYFIIFDEYASPRILQRIFEYDEARDIHAFLREQGFYVVTHSHSNYDDTLYSLPSTLNMQYLSETNRKEAMQLLEDHALKDFLRARGYTYVHMGAYLPYTNVNRYADENVTLGLLSPFQAVVWKSTVFRPIVAFVAPQLALFGAPGSGASDYRLAQWERGRDQFEKLAEIPDRDGPTFVFAHLLMPHEPFVFDTDGSFVSKEEEAMGDPTENYLNQVAYANSQIQELVKVILEKSDPAPIIILQADHGFRSETGPGEIPLDPHEQFDARFRILSAYYLPDGGDALLYPTISPVNTFRVVLSRYFGEDLPLLEDKSYMVRHTGDSRFFVPVEDTIP